MRRREQHEDCVFSVWMGYMSDFMMAFGTLLLISSKDIIEIKEGNNSKGKFQINFTESIGDLCKGSNET
jgi:hypothetical protein